MLAITEIDAYLDALTGDQSESIRAVRAQIVESNPDLFEEIDSGKWFGGMLTYHTQDRILVFALGPLSGGFSTLHMMAYYGSSALQERHGAELKKLLSGKSCVKFKHHTQLPQAAILDILAATPKYAEAAREMFAKRKKR